MEDKKRYTKIDPKQYVQYTGPTRRYPRVNPFEKKIITSPTTNSQPTTDTQKEAGKQVDPEQENKKDDSAGKS